jgi:nucleotide-binding universal stress UspA family protein
MTSAFRRVLVGYDGSEPASDALALALRLVDPGESELVLACIDEHRAFRVRPGRARTSAQVLEAGLAALPAGITGGGIELTASSAARGLRDAAEHERADLIVIGSHPGPDWRTTPGSTALRLIRSAPCAVAIAPLGLRERERIHHVGVAYDASDEAKHALAIAYALAAREHAAVSIFHAIPRIGDPYDGGTGACRTEVAGRAFVRDAQDRLDEAADRAPAGVNPRTVLIHGDALRIAKESEGIVDLLVLGSRGFGPVLRVLAGGVSESLLLDATQPVVVVPRSSTEASVEPEGVATAAP